MGESRSQIHKILHNKRMQQQQKNVPGRRIVSLTLFHIFQTFSLKSHTALISRERRESVGELLDTSPKLAMITKERGKGRGMGKARVNFWA